MFVLFLCVLFYHILCITYMKESVRWLKSLIEQSISNKTNEVTNFGALGETEFQNALFVAAPTVSVVDMRLCLPTQNHDNSMNTEPSKLPAYKAELKQIVAPLHKSKVCNQEGQLVESESLTDLREPLL